ncbi:MAG: aminotransferase class V-fold PLP-dependent enzyme [Pseudomonadota bacterium]
MTELDLNWVRAQFPALSEPSLDGWAFFENAGGSYPARQTIDRLNAFYTRMKMQPYAPYPAATEGGQWMDDAHRRIAEWLCVRTDEVMFGPSTTMNVYILARAFRDTMKEGDAVIVADQNHEANRGAWRRLAETGIEVRDWEVDVETGLLSVDDLDRLMDDKVRVVAFPHCSNIVAATNPVAEICARAGEAATVVDGVSHAPHGLPDVAALGCDFYLFSAYKTYGPHQGVMVARGEWPMRLGHQGHYFNADLAEKRLTPAGPDHAQEAAMNGVADYLDALDAHHFGEGEAGAARTGRVAALMRSQETQLLAPLLDYVRSRNDVRLLGPSDPVERVPTVAIACEQPGEDIAAKLTEHKVMCWGGDFYSRKLVERMGVDPDHGALRLSFVHYTSPEEVDQAIRALDAVL